MVRRDRPFSRTEFDRRIRVTLFGRETPVSTAEDTVIAKLEWAKAGECERQIRDVARILAISGQTLDLAYLARWIDELGLADVWDQARQFAEDSVP